MIQSLVNLGPRATGVRSMICAIGPHYRAALTAVITGAAAAVLICPPSYSSDAAASGDEAGEPPIMVSVDIRPGLCPNHIRLESPLAIPIAILGAVDFELDLVDPESVTLSREGVEAEVRPTGWTYEDVGTPLVGGLCACHKLRGDGLDDLEFWFSIQDIAAGLDLDPQAGGIVPLSLTGHLTTGERIEGLDCALVISGDWAHDEFGAEVGLLPEIPGQNWPEQGPGEHRFTYYSTVSERVTIAIYDTQGRVVARLNDMDMAPGIYSATWNGRDERRNDVPAGIYFARVNNSRASDIRKIVLTR